MAKKESKQTVYLVTAYATGVNSYKKAKVLEEGDDYVIFEHNKPRSPRKKLQKIRPVSQIASIHRGKDGDVVRVRERVVVDQFKASSVEFHGDKVACTDVDGSKHMVDAADVDIVAELDRDDVAKPDQEEPSNSSGKSKKSSGKSSKSGEKSKSKSEDEDEGGKKTKSTKKKSEPEPEPESEPEFEDEEEDEEPETDPDDEEAEEEDEEWDDEDWDDD